MLTGQWTNWTLFDNNRKYGTIQNVRFEDAVRLIQPQRFNGQTGQGQQREIVSAHVRKLKAEMVAGTFTPTSVSAWLPVELHEGLRLDENGQFSLQIDGSLPMVHTDGGHRFEALIQLKEQFAKMAETAKGEEDRQRAARWAQQIDDLPVTVTVYFDGDPAKDFVNLQAGRAVDASHMLSLSIAADLEESPDMRRAHELAKLLHNKEGSPFRNMVKFDSRGVLPLPISTICAKGSSDLGTSLVGLAKLGTKLGLDNEVLVNAVCDAHAAVESAHKATLSTGKPGLMDDGKVLTPIYSGGTKGSATMMLGLGVCLAYRLGSAGKTRAEKDDLEQLVAAAQATMNKRTGGNFSGPAKRGMLGKFASALFSDSQAVLHKGVPVELVETISASGFAVPPLPKPEKPAKVKVKTKKAAVRTPTGSTLPNIDAA